VPRLAVLASGSGSNFEALARALEPTEHKCVLLICDRSNAGAIERAERLGVPHKFVSYKGRPKREAEAEIEALLAEYGADLVALAGFLRLLSPDFSRRHAGRLVNVHPALLPAYPGLDALRRQWDADEQSFGVTIHFVDEGMDTGPLIKQGKLARGAEESFEDLEARVHALEHRLFCETVLSILDDIARNDNRKGISS